MGLFSKKNGKKETKEEGYISFTEEDLREQAQQNQANAEAYELLDAAMTTSSHITEEDKNGNQVTIDDIYPCTEQECDEMDKLLDQAEAAARDKNDSFFKERLAELRDIVAWSRQKHWTFKWPLVFGCIVSIFLLSWCKSNADQSAQRADRQYQMVDNWKEQDTTLTWAQCEKVYANIDYSSANRYKATKLQGIKHDFDRYEQQVDIDKNHLAYAENQHDKDSIQKHMEGLQKQLADIKANFDKVNKMKFKEIKKEALSYAERRKDSTASDAAWIMIYIIFCVILIPLYIWTSHQPGYYITLHRNEAKALGCVQKIGFGLASFLLGAGLAMALLPDYKVTTYYSDGSSSTHTEGNTGNIIILAIKFALMAAGVLVYCFISLLIMTYATVSALKRMYDWGKLAKQAAVAATAAATTVADTVAKKTSADKTETEA